jgi:septal ring factor EnvC (AmiA/AmiB activator)
MADSTGSATAQISIAMIGLVGSLGVAYITTGAAFKSQLASNQSAVTGLRDSITTVTARVASQLTRTQASIDQLSATRDSITAITAAISQQLAQAHESIDQLKAALTASQQQNAQIQSELAAVEQRLNTANSGVTTLTANVTALSHQAAQMGKFVQPQH